MGGDWKALLQAAETGDLELVKYYIRMGVDPNYQHPELLTAPLLESVRFGHLAIARYLLENGAEPNIVEIWEPNTPMSIAQQQNNLEAIRLLKEFGVEEIEGLKKVTNKKSWFSFLLEKLGL